MHIRLPNPLTARQNKKLPEGFPGGAISIICSYMRLLSLVFDSGPDVDHRIYVLAEFVADRIGLVLGEVLPAVEILDKNRVIRRR